MHRLIPIIDLNGSGLISIIIETIIGHTQLEQLAFNVQYLMNNSDTQERLLSSQMCNW